MDDSERLTGSFAAPVFVEAEPLALPPGRHGIGNARVAQHVLVVEHHRDVGEVRLAERLEPNLGHTRSLTEGLTPEGLSH